MDKKEEDISRKERAEELTEEVEEQLHEKKRRRQKMSDSTAVKSLRIPVFDGKVQNYQV